MGSVLLFSFLPYAVILSYLYIHIRCVHKYTPHTRHIEVVPFSPAHRAGPRCDRRRDRGESRIRDCSMTYRIPQAQRSSAHSLSDLSRLRPDLFRSFPVGGPSFTVCAFLYMLRSSPPPSCLSSSKQLSTMQLWYTVIIGSVYVEGRLRLYFHLRGAALRIRTKGDAHLEVRSSRAHWIFYPTKSEARDPTRVIDSSRMTQRMRSEMIRPSLIVVGIREQPWNGLGPKYHSP